MSLTRNVKHFAEIVHRRKQNVCRQTFLQTNTGKQTEQANCQTVKKFVFLRVCLYVCRSLIAPWHVPLNLYDEMFQKYRLLWSSIRISLLESFELLNLLCNTDIDV
uniref:(northern house mosquito) hypothetical protein n=1 Tax=Culex pipiens TaxID=7175 RepID=A0A8D8FJ58_CULPI